MRRFTEQASGAILECDGLERALREAEAGRSICSSRSVRGLAQILARLDEAKVSFARLPSPFDTASSAGRMMVQLLGAFAEFVRSSIVERTIADMERKAARGEWTDGSVPLGNPLDSERRFLVPEPSEAAVVPQIFPPLRRAP